MAVGRRIEIAGTTNLRDVGGHTAAGGRVATGVLYRAEVLVAGGADQQQAHWRPECAPDYAALGVRTVVDLRSEHEAGRTPSAWPDATDADLVRLPIAEGGEGADTNVVARLLSGELAGFDAADLAELYRGTLDRQAPTFAEVLRLLADPRRLPVLVHCSAGKDRTGLAVALVLDLLGTPRADTVADYALTGMLRPNRIDAYADRFRAAGVDPEVARVLFETPGSALHAALDHLAQRYGGTAAYLRDAGGASEAELAAVRRNLVVGAPPGHGGVGRCS